MTLIVEDGTGLSSAESYAEVADADAYFASRGISLWATDLDSTEKEEALRRATDFMIRYAWKGQRMTATQALDWPRRCASAYGFDIAQTIIPLDIKKACMELAFRAAKGPLADDIRMDSTGRIVTKIVKKTGPIDKELTYATRGQVGVPSGHIFPAVDLLVSEYVYSSGGVYR